MAALDFPDNPAVGDLYGSSGTVWRWDGARWASTAGASGARGRVAYNKITAIQSGITNGNITGLSATWAADPTRTYRITSYAEIASTVAADAAQLYVHTGSGATARATAKLAQAGIYEAIMVQAIETGLSGSITRNSLLYRSVGSGTLSVNASPDAPAFILVEDITFEAGSSGTPSASMEWQPFVPTWVNFTPGNGTPGFFKRYIGNSLDIQGVFVLGSTSVMGAASLVLPDGRTGRADLYGTLNVGTLSMGGPTLASGLLFSASASRNQVLLRYSSVNALNATVAWAALSATVPWTWAAVHYFGVNCTIPLEPT